MINCIETKICNDCGNKKLLKEFRKDRTKKDGRRSMCKICRRKSDAVYRVLNKDKINAYAKQYRLKNKKKTLEYQKRHKKNNGNYYREKDRERRAIEYNAEGNFTQQEFYQLCKLFNLKCLKCNTKLEINKLTADHIIPLSLGGVHDITNIQPLCLSCNSKKHTKTVDYRTKTIIIESKIM